MVVPVGPLPHHADYLAECLRSVAAQTLPPREVLLVDDMHGLTARNVRSRVPELGYITMRTTHAYWRLGVAQAFNQGIAAADSNLVFMLGADDMLEPQCLEHCVRAWGQNGRADAYYWVGVEYLDDRPDKRQFLPCGAAMVTKGLWQATGGFPPEAASGASDAALVSILMRHHPDWLVGVNMAKTLYRYRVHARSDTAERAPWQTVILGTRDRLTDEWQPPDWGRYYE